MKYKRITSFVLSLIMDAGLFCGIVAVQENSVEIVPEASAATASYTRIYGADRYDTAIQIANTIKSQKGNKLFNYIIVSDGRNFPDALAASYLSARKDNAPILLTNPNSTITEKITGYITSNCAANATVYLIGGTSAVSEETERILKNSGKSFRVRRLSGSDRYETNLAILEEAGVPSGSDIVVATAGNYADSLSASATGFPILLVGGALRDSQTAFLNKIKPSFVLVAGGSGAVNNTIYSALKGKYSVMRFEGVDRYETSRKIATYFQQSEKTVICYGQNFPDGLAAGPLAQINNSALLLAANNDAIKIDLASWRLSYSSNAFIALGLKAITGGYVIGGEALVNKDTADFILGADLTAIGKQVDSYLSVLKQKKESTYATYQNALSSANTAASNLTNARSEYTSAVAQYNGGAFSYFEKRGSTTALKILNGTNTTGIGTKPSGFDSYTTSAYSNGVVATGNAAHLEMMRRGIEWLLELNEVRAMEGLAPVTTNDSVWAVAILNANWAANNIGHAGAYRMNENLAWGYTDSRTNTSVAEGPFYGWYTEEKINYQTNNGKQTGHYTNILSAGKGPTAMAFSNLHPTYGTTYAMDTDAHAYFGSGVDATTYYNDFIRYYNTTKGNISTAQTKITAYTAQKSAADAALKSANTAYVSASAKYESEYDRVTQNYESLKNLFQ
ncbi:MAG: cell wall-binding repeat-containing protein [Lachnospiraceae bacterium]|nr:cell wall-binding repeat-containing protein [Lachnospiraceae bacterium]